MNFWKCTECGKEHERLQICWGMSYGEKVDVLDYFCQDCGCTDLDYSGTPLEKNDYWDKEWDNGFSRNKF